MVQIQTQTGRSTADKQRLYATINARLVQLGIRGEDAFVSYIERARSSRG